MQPQLTPTDQLRSLINGYQISQGLHVLASLGIPDVLKTGPRSAEELAGMTSTDPRSLYRLLRALASVGVLDEGDNQVFGLTDLGQGLRSDAPNSLSGWATFIGRPYYWEAWGHLAHSVRTGQSAFEALHDGQSVWDWRTGHPDESAIFDRAMVSLAGAAIEQLVGHYDFTEFHTLVDIGGSRGQLIAAILARNPDARGILFDLPHVVAGAESQPPLAAVSARCEVVGGDFFDQVPGGADAYILKSVLHDWDDPSSHRILQSVRRACPENARLLVIEPVIAPPNEGAPEKFSDLNMLVSPGGRERTLDEWSELFTHGGFELNETFPVGGGWNVILGKPR